MSTKQIISALKNGQVGVLPTDTVYGLHAKAMDVSAVEKIYQLKDRTGSKPVIVLISSLSDLNLFGVKLSDKNKDFLKKIWPNPVSVILPVKNPKFEYLHRGTYSLAFRIPNNTLLLTIIKETGPLVSTSANPEGKPVASSILQAKKYFKKQSISIWMAEN